VIPVSVPEGTEIVRQGEPGDQFYIVQSGTADVVVDGYAVGSVGPGGSFGERSLLRDVARMATVKSREPMQLLALSREDFLTALTGEPESGFNAGAVALQAGAKTVASALTKRDKIGLLSRISLFSHLDSSTLHQLAEKSAIDRWPEGAAIIRQGEEGDRFFVMLDGKAAVSVDERSVNELHPGDQFGEIALLHEVPRSAAVTASSPVVTLSLHRDDFVSAVQSQVVLG